MWHRSEWYDQRARDRFVAAGKIRIVRRTAPVAGRGIKDLDKTASLIAVQHMLQMTTFLLCVYRKSASTTVTPAPESTDLGLVLALQAACFRCLAPHGIEANI